MLEFGQIAAGPFTGSLLADLGADVVKVERPDGGDGMRDWPPLSGESDRVFGGNFASLNRNKRSITVDLKNPEDIARLRKLCARADVLIENFRAGVLARLGLVALSARKDIVSTSSRGRSSAFVMCCLSAARWRFVLCAPRVIREES